MNKGTIEYQEVILSITEISLLEGSFLIIAVGKGPLAEYHGPARIIGPDGVLVQYGGHIDCPSAESGENLRLVMTMTPDDLEAHP
jgi:hypothetical protein